MPLLTILENAVLTILEVILGTAFRAKLSQLSKMSLLPIVVTLLRKKFMSRSLSILTDTTTSLTLLVICLVLLTIILNVRILLFLVCMKLQPTLANAIESSKPLEGRKNHTINPEVSGFLILLLANVLEIRGLAMGRIAHTD
jgi:hypothetical protein